MLPGVAVSGWASPAELAHPYCVSTAENRSSFELAVRRPCLFLEYSEGYLSFCSVATKTPVYSEDTHSASWLPHPEGDDAMRDFERWLFCHLSAQRDATLAPVT
jgi:hypothetical protein